MLKMVDCVCLLVDAFEGPMPQTRFVTRKALALGLRPILVVNKVDRAGLRSGRRRRRDLRPVLRAGRHRRAARLPDRLRVGPRGLGGQGPQGHAHRPVAAARPDRREGAAAVRATSRRPWPCTSPRWTTTTTWATSPSAGSAPAASSRAIACCASTATARRKSSASPSCWATSRSSASSWPRPPPATSARSPAWQDLTVGETITEIARPVVLPLLEIEEPTVKMQFMSNNGPFAGQEGKYVTSRNLRDRLFKEVKSNVALRVVETPLARHLRRAGPRRAAPVGADRDDAARRLRADGFAAAGHLQDRRRRREAGAVRRGRHRPGRGLFGRRHRGARAPRRPHAGDGAGRRGAHAPRVPLPGARPHRLPRRSS